MKRRPPALLFTCVAVASCLLGYWLLLPREQVEPLPQMQQWDAELFRPQFDERLTVAQLSQFLPRAELWLQPRMDGPHLLLRGERDGWQVEGELDLSDNQRASLTEVSGARPNDPEQPLSAGMLEQLSGQHIEGLNLLPQHRVMATALSASLGEPRLRLQLPKGEAWVYPQQGLTAHIEDDRVRLLRVVPKRFLQH